MGQSTSGEQQSFQRTVTNDELSKLFAQQCARGLQPIELISLRTNLERIGKGFKSTNIEDDIISETEFQSLLSVTEDLPHLRHIIYSMVTSLAQFPLLGHSTQPLTSQGLLKALCLLSKDRCSKIFNGNVDYLKLIFIALSVQSSKASPPAVDDTQTVKYQKPGVISWSELPIVKTFDGLNIDSLSVPADELLDIIAVLLACSRLKEVESLKKYSHKLSKLDEYKKNALPILKSMSPNITSSNLQSSSISLAQFRHTIETVALNLLGPLSCLLESLLYTSDVQDTTEDHDEIHGQGTLDEPHHSRIINPYTISQLSTYFSSQLVFSNISKLYIGRDSGFSMRSFESKVFKWNAPSIVLLKGSRITKNKSSSNPRYRKFEEQFPRLPASSPAVANSSTNDETIIYGIYVDQPWRVSNKETFGTSQTVIFQLAPVQRVFTTAMTAKHFLYFSTLGGGIGVGSALPTIKGNNELVRYNPGNVSLTIDSSLEFAVFRNLGIGGEFKSLSGGVSDEDTYEDRFMLSDVEVWGCGGEKELEEQNKRWEWEQAEAKRRQQINLKSMGEDRALLEMAGLVGQHQSGGSI
ncbi:Restriction of telomere capping protein 5 [Cyberlindnera fabianii]|uniref:Restriction of telomere capping protein 5 n=1 Tax=Cyberlindnera fabianii TaxID=36022 RepID=A0A1V2L261_CYBFA|nr:Restriction of telomere capping protein 5 [Cyberlindnera fabianii]